MRPQIPRPLQFLDEQQIDAIHASVLKVLSQVGVRVEWRPALEIFDSYGCPVDFGKKVVKIRQDVLQTALRTCPQEFTLYARDPGKDIHVTLDDIFTIAGSSALNVLDLDGKHRPAMLQDLVEFTRLIDALPMADVMHAMVIPQDIPQQGFDRILFSNILKNTTKHYYSQGQGGRSVSDQVQLAGIVQGSVDAVRMRPCFSFVICLNSPLVHAAARTQEMMECARYGIPVWLEATNMMGATGPVSIAGALVEHTANVLTGVTLMQLLNPGHPCVFSVASGGFNMHSGGYVAASPEAVLLHCATAQIAHHFGLPFQGGSGVDSCLPDSQAAYERMMQAVTMSLSGVNFIHLAFGMMAQLLTSSCEQAVIDNEILEAAWRLGRGILVTPDTLAVEQIAQAGPGGQFLNQRHTRLYYRKEHWQPKLTLRAGWDEFQREHAGNDMRQRANALARRILKEYCPAPLDNAQTRELDRLAGEMQKRAGAGQ